MNEAIHRGEQHLDAVATEERQHGQCDPGSDGAVGSDHEPLKAEPTQCAEKDPNLELARSACIKCAVNHLAEETSQDEGAGPEGAIQHREQDASKDDREWHADVPELLAP